MNAKGRAKLLEKLLTDANESARAFAQFGGDLAAVRMRLLTTQYAELVAKLVDRLEVDETGRILTNKANLELRKMIDQTSGAFRKAVSAPYGPLRDAGMALAGSVEAGSKAMRAVLKATKVDDAAVSAFDTDAVLYGKAVWQKGALKIATNLSEQVNGVVTDAIMRYAGDKDTLISRLFSPKGLEHFKARNAEMKAAALELSGKAKDLIAELKAGRLDIAQVRDTYRSEVSAYIADRKAYLEAGQTPSLFEDMRHEQESITVAKKQIIEAHQDSVYRSAAKALPKTTLWVNAKNTGFEDNCVDAMNADPMTMEQWKASEFGLPRSDKRDCTVYCECILFPVGNDDIATGADISDIPEGADL